jgi:hypothetical protein
VEWSFPKLVLATELSGTQVGESDGTRALLFTLLLFSFSLADTNSHSADKPRIRGVALLYCLEGHRQGYGQRPRVKHQGV